MHKMMMLRDNLVDELEKFADKPLNEQSLDLVDKLAHAIKCIDTVSAMERAENDGYSGRSYRDGMSRRTYRDDYSGDGVSGRRYFYTQRDGMSGMRRRDSLGRYADGYSHDEAKDRLMNEMQGMMGDVSPEAQHAIQKAINALGNE
ncbi:MAG: hypothetical protein IIX95_03490 [Clostridiales bacterium]|nr:hypothetical protein [Clostridiales bacterium]